MLLADRPVPFLVFPRRDGPSTRPNGNQPDPDPGETDVRATRASAFFFFPFDDDLVVEDSLADPLCFFMVPTVRSVACWMDLFFFL